MPVCVLIVITHVNILNRKRTSCSAHLHIEFFCLLVFLSDIMDVVILVVCFSIAINFYLFLLFFHLFLMHLRAYLQHFVPMNTSQLYDITAEILDESE